MPFDPWPVRFDVDSSDDFGVQDFVFSVNRTSTAVYFGVQHLFPKSDGIFLTLNQVGNGSHHDPHGAIRHIRDRDQVYLYNLDSARVTAGCDAAICRQSLGVFQLLLDGYIPGHAYGIDRATNLADLNMRLEY